MATTGVTQEIARILRGKLAEQQLNQTQAAAIIGRVQSYISDRLDGKKPFTVDELALLCFALEIKPSAVLQEAETRLGQITQVTHDTGEGRRIV
jgi:predicted XRE-type DNA-binding protein